MVQSGIRNRDLRLPTALTSDTCKKFEPSNSAQTYKLWTSWAYSGQKERRLLNWRCSNRKVFFRQKIIEEWILRVPILGVQGSFYKTTNKVFSYFVFTLDFHGDLAIINKEGYLIQTKSVQKLKFSFLKKKKQWEAIIESFLILKKKWYKKI